MKYKTWRSHTDKALHVVCLEGEAFEALPQIVRKLGPWQGSRDGDVANLKPVYRALIAEQGFVVAYAHVSVFKPES